jgi:hypothetical protein
VNLQAPAFKERGLGCGTEAMPPDNITDTGSQNTISGLLRKHGEMLANLAPRIKWRATGARVLLFQLLGEPRHRPCDRSRYGGGPGLAG